CMTWRPIPDFPDYEINHRGEIKRVRRRPDGKGKMGQILRTDLVWGKPRVRLYNGTGAAKKGRFYVSRLVAAAFLGMDLYSPSKVIHKDEDNKNLDYTNLIVGDSSTRVRIAASYGAGSGVRKSNAKLTEEDVVTIHR